MSAHHVGPQKLTGSAVNAPSLEARWRLADLAQALTTAWGASTHPAQSAPRAQALALEDVGSTNTRMLEMARSDNAPMLRLLVAERQSAGRGRLGRAWHSAPGESLTFSLAMSMPAAMDAGLSLAVGAAVAQTIEPDMGLKPQVMLKWPNDIWLRDEATPMGGRKLAGVLIETVSTPHGRVLVVGVGINLVAPSAPLAQPPDYGVASVAELTLPWSPGPDPAAVALLHQLAPPLVSALRRHALEGLAPWAAEWAARDILWGQKVQASVGSHVVDGVACGVRADGALWVQANDGQRHALVSGEVSVRVKVERPPFAR